MSRRRPSPPVEAPLLVKALVNLLLIFASMLLGTILLAITGNAIAAMTTSFLGIIVLSALLYRPLLEMVYRPGGGRRPPRRRRR